MRKILISLFTFLLGLTGLAAVTQSHRVVNVTDASAMRPGETSIAINPKNLDNIIGVSMQGGRPGGPRVSNYAYVTSDGGKTWKTIAAHNPRALTQGDDAITFDAHGTAHRTYISFDGIRQPRPPRAMTGIFLSSSTDGGATWSYPIPVVDHINTVLPFEDKPYIRADRTADSPHKNNLYVAWTRFDEYGNPSPDCKSYIYFARSTDGGKSFVPPLRVSDTTGNCVDDDETVEGAVPAVGVKGEVYLVWAGPRGLVFDKSLDGGLTFGADKVIQQTPGGWNIPMPGFNRHNGMPVTGIDLSDGANRGSLYVNWIDERNGDTDVFIMYTRDGGTTWSEAVRVNDDPLKNGKAQFFTWMAVDPAEGSINVVFYDRRDYEGTKTGLTLARSVDGGKTFMNHKIAQSPFECSADVFFGDYLGIDAQSGLVAAIYNHFTSSTQLAVSVALFKFKPGTQEMQP